MSETLHLINTIPGECKARRLDQALADTFPEHSRSRLSEWIKHGKVTVNGEIILQPRHKIMGNEAVEIKTTLPIEQKWVGQDIPLDIVYEDDSLLVINKPAGLVVHPAAGNPDQTLVNALLHYDPALNQLPRCGIVHRLDKDTTGILVVARTLTAHTSLVAQLQTHSMHREYIAVVNRLMIAGGTVEAALGRHPRDRKRRAVTQSGKPAITHYRILEKFRAQTYIQVKLETGRTHQIRVHMAHIHHPIVGDPVYGGRLALPKHASPALMEALRSFKRQALHAKKLQLTHPATQKQMCWSVPIPDDIQQLLAELKNDAEQS